MARMYGLFILSVILSVILLTACSSNKSPGLNDGLAQCLTEKKATMYGTEWCPHCKAQKEIFGKSFQYVTYVDCDRFKNECIGAGVEGYPTWKINGTNYAGTQNLYLLAEKSGCLDKLTGNA